MQWLTAILAFATTMLIFSMIVSTLVETIHRFSGSRPFGLIKMLEHLYDEVLSPYLTRGNEEIRRRQFVDEMIRIRPANGATADQSDGAAGEDTPPTSMLKSWNMLPHLPVEMFMERLGASNFSTALDKTFAEGSEEREQALKDIAQKFELYGQEAGIYFERKARSWSVAVALFVAWIFYVHPYELIHTYLAQPEVAAAVADLHDDALKQFEEIEDKLGAAGAPVDGELSEEILKELEKAREELEPLQAAGAPIGWSDDKGKCFSDLWSQTDAKAAGGDQQQKSAKACWVYVPTERSDFIWLILGGLLVGLGAPFWAKAVRQITEVRNISENITRILKPEERTQANQGQPATTSDTSSVPEKAFSAAATAPKS